MTTKSLLEQLDRVPEDRHPEAPDKYAGLPLDHPAIPPSMKNVTPPKARKIDPAGIVRGILDDLINNVMNDGTTGTGAKTSTKNLRSRDNPQVKWYPK